jgi:Lon protease-like protein
VSAFHEIAQLPQTAPLFPIQGAVLFPRATIALNVFEPRYLNMVDDAMAGDRLIGIIQPTEAEDGAPPPLAPVGAVGQISSFAETEDGRYLITLLGVCRFRLKQELPRGAPYRKALVDYEEFADDLDAPADPDGRAELEAALLTYAREIGFTLEASALARASVEDLVSAAATLGPFDPPSKQALLEARRLKERCDVLVALLERRRQGPLS